jgi:hypothetical protein
MLESHFDYFHYYSNHNFNLRKKQQILIHNLHITIYLHLISLTFPVYTFELSNNEDFLTFSVNWKKQNDEHNHH